jgi:dihydrofolate reductase
VATVVYSMQVSLDGFIEAADASLDFAIVDEEVHRAFNAQEAAVEIAVYGRRLWEVMGSYWPTADTNPNASDVEVEYARIWQALPKIVVSRTLPSVEGPNVRLSREDPVALVESLRGSTEGVISVGGPTLAAALIERDVVDEYQPYVEPVLLGAGKRFLPDGVERRRLDLVETRRFASGVVSLRYRRNRDPGSP